MWVKEYVFWTDLPAATSWLMTSVNSVSPSAIAAVAARLRSCERRASDSMMRSRTAYRAILFAVSGVIDESKAVTFAGRSTGGMGGGTQTRPVAGAGPELLGGGSAPAAAVEIQPATSGPLPTMSGTAGLDPSGSAGAGSGPCVERSAATGSAVTRSSVTPSTAGDVQPSRRTTSIGPASSSPAVARISAKRPAHAITREARIAVLVQNSSVVGPMSSTERRPTAAPNTIRARGLSGTVLGSGTMNSAKTRTSGEVTRICHSWPPHIAVECQLATMQWSGTGESATARAAANAIM